MCEHLNLHYVPQYLTFHKAGHPYWINTQLYARDHIHLNKLGTSILLHNINKFAPILQAKRNTCFYCGEPNHTTETCTHGKSLKCNQCQEYGHKQNRCTNI